MTNHNHRRICHMSYVTQLTCRQALALKADCAVAFDISSVINEDLDVHVGNQRREKTDLLRGVTTFVRWEIPYQPLMTTQRK